MTHEDNLSHEADRLTERWILAFLEPPPLVDVELMRRVLAEYGTEAEEKVP